MCASTSLLFLFSSECLLFCFDYFSSSNTVFIDSIFRLSEDGRITNSTYRWCSTNIQGQISSSQPCLSFLFSWAAALELLIIHCMSWLHTLIMHITRWRLDVQPWTLRSRDKAGERTWNTCGHTVKLRTQDHFDNYGLNGESWNGLCRIFWQNFCVAEKFCIYTLKELINTRRYIEPDFWFRALFWFC